MYFQIVTFELAKIKNKNKNHGKEPLRNPYVFRIRCENCYDVISVQVLFFDILLGVDIIDCSQMEISFFVMCSVCDPLHQYVDGILVRGM